VPTGDLGETIVLRIDAHFINTVSREEAAARLRGRCGHHPMAVICDNTTEYVAEQLRPGNAGANDAADHIALPQTAIAARWRRNLLITADGAGATHQLLRWIESLNRPPPALPEVHGQHRSPQRTQSQLLVGRHEHGRHRRDPLRVAMRGVLGRRTFRDTCGATRASARLSPGRPHAGSGVARRAKKQPVGEVIGDAGRHLGVHDEIGDRAQSFKALPCRDDTPGDVAVKPGQGGEHGHVDAVDVDQSAIVESTVAARLADAEVVSQRQIAHDDLPCDTPPLAPLHHRREHRISGDSGAGGGSACCSVRTARATDGATKAACTPPTSNAVKMHQS
jgi:hypothetical protein